MKLEDRRKALLLVVQEYREQECRRLLDAAQAEAAGLIRDTFRKQRSLLHNRVVAERARAQARIQAARAERATRDRRRTEQASIVLLEAAWPLLRARLADLWSVPERRRAWTERYLRRGLELLPRGRWEVRHAAAWSESERGDAVQELSRRLGRSPRFETDGGMEAGLIIACEGAVLDASLEGLLRDRQRLEARLLALLEER
jgi:hypothetical protein